MNVLVLSKGNPNALVFGGSQASDRPVLLPPDKDLLIHIESPGFKEWDQSAGLGKALRMESGGQLQFDVQLDPSR